MFKTNFYQRGSRPIASYASAGMVTTNLFVRLSVRPSVWHTLALYRNKSRLYFTDGWCEDSIAFFPQNQVHREIYMWANNVGLMLLLLVSLMLNFL